MGISTMLALFLDFKRRAYSSSKKSKTATTSKVVKWSQKGVLEAPQELWHRLLLGTTSSHFTPGLHKVKSPRSAASPPRRWALCLPLICFFLCCAWHSSFAH